MLCVTILFHYLICFCVLHLSSVHVVTLSYHHFIFVVFTNQIPSHSFRPPQSISYISCVIVHLIHHNSSYHHSSSNPNPNPTFHIGHNWSYSCYIVIQPYLQDISRNTFFLKVGLSRLRQFLPNQNFPQTCQKKSHRLFGV